MEINMNDLINRLENNRFIDDVRQNLTFNVAEYTALIALLQEIETRTPAGKPSTKSCRPRCTKSPNWCGFGTSI